MRAARPSIDFGITDDEELLMGESKSNRGSFNSSRNSSFTSSRNNSSRSLTGITGADTGAGTNAGIVGRRHSISFSFESTPSTSAEAKEQRETKMPVGGEGENKGMPKELCLNFESPLSLGRSASSPIESYPSKKKYWESKGNGYGSGNNGGNNSGGDRQRLRLDRPRPRPASMRSLPLPGSRLPVIPSLSASLPTLPAQEPPSVIISGAHISANPTPATGMARAIRLVFPGAELVGLGDREDKICGVNDGAFTRGIVVTDGMGLAAGVDCDHSVSQNWTLVRSLMEANPASLYIPGTDADVDRLSPRITATTHSRRGFVGQGGEEEEDASILRRILCPSEEAVELTAKPGIVGAAMMGRKKNDVFSVPEYLVFDPDAVAKTDVEDWCKRNGYPVIVKGMHQGAGLCNRWEDVAAAMLKLDPKAGGYVQKHVVGFQMGIAYCAFNGELTAAVMMEKGQYMGTKAWGGELRAVPPHVTEALRTFCRVNRWTGGGELEFIEDLDGKWHAIDWNPRFPAWIFASSFTGCNLPAALIQHVLHATRPDLGLPFPSAAQQASLTARASFSRTVIEVPSTLHYQPKVDAGFVGLGGYVGGKGVGPNAVMSNGCNVRSGVTLGQLPPTVRGEDGGEDGGEEEDVAVTNGTDASTATKVAKVAKGKVAKVTIEASQRAAAGGEQQQEDQLVADERVVREEELRRLLPADPSQETQTPRFVLCLKTVRESLLSHKGAVEAAMAKAGNPCAVDMCLSVKTQPHPSVLRVAKECGYRGEVITFAEMQGCLDAGWTPEEIVVNGPGKLYNGYNAAQIARVDAPLGAVYADSLADLVTILRRIEDPHDWLKAKVVGVRLAPFWAVRSRFGIDTRDPDVLATAAELLNGLPEDVEIGFHQHYASSTVGVDQWFCIAHGYVKAVKTLSRLLRKAPVQIDFGGGWPAHLLDQPVVALPLQKLFEEVRDTLPTIKTVSFELGKCVTERAGGLLTKVLEVREGSRKIPKKSRKTRKGQGKGKGVNTSNGTHNNSRLLLDDDLDEIKVDGDESEDGSGDEDDEEETPCGVVVDACISDLGSLPTHVHPVLWHSTDTARANNGGPAGKAYNSGNAAALHIDDIEAVADAAADTEADTDSDSDNDCANSEGVGRNGADSDGALAMRSGKSTKEAWSRLPAGKDAILGSICMEFDLLAVSVKVPADAKVGDHLLIAYTGSYDATMAYDFADAKGRDFLLLNEERARE